MMKKELTSLKVLMKIRFDEIYNCKWNIFFIIQVLHIRNISINESNGSAFSIS